MPVSEQQRQWLDKAIRKKGRLTRKATIKEEFNNYIRCRDKVMELFDGLDWSKESNEIRKIVKGADGAAEEGKFNSAYKRLDSAKKRIRAFVGDRGNELDIEELELRIRSFDQTIRKRVLLNNLIAQNLDNALQDMDDYEKAKDQDNLDDAIKVWKVFHGDEAERRGYIAEARKILGSLTQVCKQPDMNNEPDVILQKLTQLNFAGRENDGGRMRDKYEAANDTLKNNYDKLRNATVAGKLIKAKTLEFEKACLEIKDMSAWQSRDKTKNIRDNVLKATDNRLALIQREEDRLKWVQYQFNPNYALECDGIL